MKYVFQHFFDIATTSESMQVIKVSCGGKETMKRCAHLFPAYKYYKLGAVRLKMVPASTLPVDPLGLSYDDEDVQTIDPRDQMNPGLIRITNGEDIFDNISSLSSDEQEKIYINMMLDPHWFKWQLQSGFQRSAVPLYWQVGQYHQDYFPGATVNYPVVGGSEGNLFVSNTGRLTMSDTRSLDGSGDMNACYRDVGFSDPRGFFQTGHRGRLGYLPTDGLIPSMGGAPEVPTRSAMAEIETFTIVLPKAYKTSYYYRCYVTETVYFSGIRTVNGMLNGLGELDQFIRPGAVQTLLPNTSGSAYGNLGPGQASTMPNTGGRDD